MRYPILFVICLSLMTSCYQKSNTISIDDFSKPFTDTLIYKENGSYSNAQMIIEGFTNDTIIIKFYGIERKYYGPIKDKWDVDYYGSINVSFTFEPYKATEGSLNIKYGIY